MVRVVLAGLVLLPLLASLVQLSRSVHGGRVGFSPLIAFTGAWAVQLALGVTNPLRLETPALATLLLLAGAVTAFVVGYAVTFRFLIVTPRQELASSRSAVALWLFLALAGGALFVLLVAQLVAAYGLNPAAALLGLRTGLAEGRTPTGFYFFYFLTPLVALSVALAAWRHNRWWLLPAGLAAVALLATSGRTNAITAMVWAVFVAALLRGERRLGLREVAVGLSLVAASLGAFLVLGTALGKTYDNSVFRVRFGAEPPVPKSLVLPLLYGTAAVPTLDAQVEDGRNGGERNLLRPVLQLAAVVNPRIEVPEKIQQFEFVPFPYNVATYVSPLYRDAGVPGVLLGSFVLGAVSGAAFRLWRDRRGPGLLVLVGLVSAVGFASAGDAAFTELSVNVQAGLLVLVALAERSTRETRVLPA